MNKWMGVLAGLIASLLVGKTAAPTDADLIRFFYRENADAYSIEYRYDAETGQTIAFSDPAYDENQHTAQADEAFVQTLRELIDRHDLWAWNGFERHDRIVSDGRSFRLDIAFEDGTVIEASGNMRFPDGYRETAAEIKDLFRRYAEGREAAPDVGAKGSQAQMSSFRYHRTGSSMYDIYSYEVTADEETGRMIVQYEFRSGNETYALLADEAFLQALDDLIGRHDLRTWDGFRGINSGVLDGCGFGLTIGYEDGTQTAASGSNRYPEGYSEAASDIDELFRGYLKANAIEREGS